VIIINNYNKIMIRERAIRAIVRKIVVIRVIIIILIMMITIHKTVIKERSL